MKQKRLVLVAGDPLLRRLLTEWIAEEPDLDLVGESADSVEGVRLARYHECELVSIDPARYAPGIRFSCHRLAVLTEIRHGVTVKRESLPAGGPAMIVMVAGTGGPLSLSRLWRTLPEDMEAAVLVAQHMPLSFTDELARRLNEIGSMECRVATAGTHPEPGIAYISPGGVHMTLGSNGEVQLDRRSTPAGTHTIADHLLRSCAERFGPGMLAMILSGYGSDGVAGAEATRLAGGSVVVESAESALVPDLPQRVIAAGSGQATAPVQKLLAQGYEACSGGRSCAA